MIIAKKYSEYNRLRGILAGKAVSSTCSSPQRQKRKRDSHEPQPPSKRLQLLRTPSKSRTHPAQVDPYDSPSALRNLTTPLKNKVLGPTPQKDGQVLGIFDLLEEEENFPSKAAVIDATIRPRETPRKANHYLDVPGSGRHSRTPASSGKRFLLDTFATPLKSKHPNEHGGKTPSSVSKLDFSTPSFLRRGSHRPKLPSISELESNAVMSPEMVRVPRKPLVRGLSSILASLRKIEDDTLDDDLDALREMESGGPPTKSKADIPSKEEVLVEDSQAVLPLGGFDDEGKYDSEPEVSHRDMGREGQPLKPWKKKGQKRTTRRVNMKPVRAKPSVAANVQDGMGSGDEDELHADPTSQQADAVPETQQVESIYGTNHNFDSDSGSEYTASEGGTRYRREDQPKKKVKVVEKDGIQTKVKRVAASAHANFKRLKLRNSGAKGTIHGHGSRFRRKK